MEKPVIIVSGKNGQLGNELNDIANNYALFEFHFFDRTELDIANTEAINTAFEKFKPTYFINTAAYTAVDKAEAEQEQAYLINAEATGNIAKACKAWSTKLIHVSTDYVFSGKGTKPYKEDDATDPVNYYGYTKWIGEQLALQNNPQTIVIRTSWVYSVYGNNFVKTMMRLMKDRTDINVVNDQYGSPTYAKDLAEAIIQIIVQNNFQPGIYHFSNSGEINWHTFASAIKDAKHFNCNVHAIPSSQYPTPAKRPAYSVMSKEKIVNVYNIQLKPWQQSLAACLGKL
ncbi:dTDP-4-dehydrorhamnose reductase [Panacibacter ginsenosidivorans]|uniref:dTDP-4-dehydrorhamnose reductase n=1 Tax=Panacibacter ginsenosidivorans TaxID=1813871 RepID=A0A5B8V5C6_9BACT|nr:dTDP-4-dehydrorhamnose reductase [Panacibacter ginsenosidivorans]QEC66389.1 dTDP-4-dehydrorhamnose reductase [Panacibacter ginsenosidivorans]